MSGRVASTRQGLVRTLLEWADQVLSKMLGDWVAEWIDTSQTVMTTRATAELKKKFG